VIFAEKRMSRDERWRRKEKGESKGFLPLKCIRGCKSPKKK
jgi:hypothetical protein